MADLSLVTNKSEKKNTVAKSDKTLLKDAKERIMHLQKKNIKKPSTKEEAAVKKVRKPKGMVNRRGVVYLGHIPHGFYEEELKGFFSQFGEVSRVKVSRSPKTGKSKGYAFIEFAFNDVAKIVAETMNNYLMFERLVKAQYIPPEKVHSKTFPVRFMTEESYPALVRRNRLKTKQNKPSTEKDKLKHRSRILFKITRAMSTLKKMGIDHQPQIYDPEAGKHTNDHASVVNVDEVPQLVEIQVAIPDSKLAKNLPMSGKRNNSTTNTKPAPDTTPTKVDAVHELVTVQPSTPRDLSPKLTRHQRKATEKKNKGNSAHELNLTSDLALDDTPTHSPNKRLRRSDKPTAISVATPLKKNSKTSIKPSPQPAKVSVKVSPIPDSTKIKSKTFGKETAASSKLPIRSVKGKKPV